MFSENIKYFIFVGILLALPLSVQANSMSMEINVNSNDLEGKINTKVPMYESMVDLGGGVLYSDDDYFLGNINFSLTDQLIVPNLTFGLGFKGIYGQVDMGPKDYDIMAIGFLLTGEYDLRGEINFPLTINAGLTLSPAPLSFMDTDKYLDYSLNANFHIVSNAAIVLGYRNINLKIEENNNKRNMNDDALYLGYKLIF
jgi:hypothetical protein